MTEWCLERTLNSLKAVSVSRVMLCFFSRAVKPSTANGQGEGQGRDRGGEGQGEGLGCAALYSSPQMLATTHTQLTDRVFGKFLSCSV